MGGGTTSKTDIFTFIDYCIQCLTCSAVPFFFLASGFLLYKDLTFSNIKVIIKRKLKRYFIPYIIWSIICFIIIDYLRCMDYKYIPLFLLTSSFNGTLWFIEILIIFVLLSPVLLLIFRNKKFSLILLTLIFVISYYMNISINSTSLAMSLISPYQDHLKIALPYYLLGCFLGRFYFETINNEKYISRILIAVASICLLILYGQYFNNFPIRLIGIAYDTLIKFQCVLLWIIFPKKIFTYQDHWWYHRTFFTYAAQWIFIWITSKLIQYSSYDISSMTPFIFLSFRILIFSIITAVTIVIGQCVILISPKLYSILTGETTNKHI